MIEDDVHRKLIKAFQEYYNLNWEWENKQTHTAGIKSRQILSDICKLSKARRDEIQAVRITKPKIKSPKYRQSLLKDQKGNDDT
jgi:hypothetical protein